MTGDTPPEAPERAVNDKYVPAIDIGRGRYRPDFLAAIDWGLRPLPKDRPQTVKDWRTAFTGGRNPQSDGGPPPSSGPAPAATPNTQPTAARSWVGSILKRG
jgi:hypothetical protein